MTTKTAIVIYSDPKSGSEEALGRLFNGLAYAHELKANREEVKVAFAGTGTRWPEIISHLDHPAYGLFNSIKDSVLGVSCGCAELFGAKKVELPLLKDNPLPGTDGTLSLHKLTQQGFNILSF